MCISTCNRVPDAPAARPHVVPVLGLWLGGSPCFNTARQARKAADLARHPGCVLTGADTDVDLVVGATRRRFVDH
ncbi:pyridoxamine 5'-phosphate oxidase family protein [Yinghuangia seranimata]|uniref:pyridoxamine 5'-phosphate oxidase family protein n=1 Tax=Yinghuangia seranimata TaxID=408067 RepID=UPI00248AEFB3|nr:pyridoxamine 5'-phosphate oxidase family protein [Yinghuangia seranimata]MDI2128505.1 pyridoxamine 5'-phosphate oxidase family protein [Yinghuangia seranimata]